MSIDSEAVTTPPLVDLLVLAQIGEREFQSTSERSRGRPMYGGQVAAQALMAAGRTVPPDRVAHSLHCYFLRPGDSAVPTTYRVEIDRDGRSYSARRVVAIQNQRVILNLSASFREVRDGNDRSAVVLPPVPDPEECQSLTVDPTMALRVRVPRQPSRRKYFPPMFWVRPNCELPRDDHLSHAAAMTYMSDFSSGLYRNNGDTEILGASLDHALWFHHTPNWDNWMLVDLGVGVAAELRGWYPGAIFDRRGFQAASLAQEMVYRDSPA
jgi:acyl-CoA thioesterase-2